MALALLRCHGLTPGWILCWLLSVFSLRVGKWATAVCASGADSILAVVKKQKQDSPWESISVRVLCPPCRTESPSYT